jgi:hypothetical protein
MTTDLDVSIRPQKWRKRGVQPAVDPTPKALLIALNDMAEQIRIESDPITKKRLEAEYSSRAKEIEKFTSDGTSIKLGEAITEIVATFSPIIDPHPDTEDGIRMPETMNREQWQEVHSRIMQCKRAAAGWLARSRRFASDRWGIAFVEKCEAQMELALGIEHHEQSVTPTVDHIKVATSIARRVCRWSNDLDTIDSSTRQIILETLHPVVEIIKKLQGVEEQRNI